MSDNVDPDKVLSILQHADAGVGSAIGATAGLATTYPPGTPWWGQLIGGLILAIAPIALKALMGYLQRPKALPPPAEKKEETKS